MQAVQVLHFGNTRPRMRVVIRERFVAKISGVVLERFDRCSGSLTKRGEAPGHETPAFRGIPSRLR